MPPDVATAIGKLREGVAFGFGVLNGIGDESPRWRIERARRVSDAAALAYPVAVALGDARTAHDLGIVMVWANALMVASAAELPAKPYAPKRVKRGKR